MRNEIYIYFQKYLPQKNHNYTKSKKQYIGKPAGVTQLNN